MKAVVIQIAQRFAANRASCAHDEMPGRSACAESRARRAFSRAFGKGAQQIALRACKTRGISERHAEICAHEGRSHATGAKMRAESPFVRAFGDASSGANVKNFAHEAPNHAYHTPRCSETHTNSFRRTWAPPLIAVRNNGRRFRPTQLQAHCTPHRGAPRRGAPRSVTFIGFLPCWRNERI